VVPQASGKYQFGVFELDREAVELRKRGVRIRLQEQPFRILCALLETPGEIVSREKLKAILWPDDTFVEFERGMNAAVAKLRQALGDSAENPRFIETIPRRGYRFIASVAAADSRVPPLNPAPSPDPMAPADPMAVAHEHLPRNVLLVALAACLVLFTGHCQLVAAGAR
jgi:DNA-binding winged helix-turn-helix (wHTH) protein